MNDHTTLDFALDPKRQKFVELTEKRTRNAVRAIQIIGKVGGNRSAYRYDEHDVDQIAAALAREIDTMRNRMLGSKRAEAEFSFATATTADRMPRNEHRR